jgi:hypothetical protein
MRRLLLVLLLPAAVFVAFNARAVEPKRFPLNQPYNEAEIVACLSADTAISLQNLSAAGKDKEVQAAFERAVAAGVCGYGAATVTYKRQVFKVERKGSVWTVYEASFEGVTIFVPMKDWLHETIGA